VDGDALIDLFEDLVTELSARLAGVTDWGPSGLRDSQYNHDVVADEVIVPRLVAEGLGVLSEESGLTPAGPVTVVVDPIDGSTNASRDLPWYATSLCAVDADGPLAAVVANLATGERFRAVRGQGAEVSAGDGGWGGVAPSGRTAIGESIVAFSGLPKAHGGWAQFRVYGAAALDMCAVACGRFDAYVDLNRAHGVWDYLGALLVCSEAGASVVDSGGEDLVVLDVDARRGPVAAASPELLDYLLADVVDTQ
jgi:fructose-1,6-bisphosphatase/inositol monophosphatase family enzyme